MLCVEKKRKAKYYEESSSEGEGHDGGEKKGTTSVLADDVTVTSE